MSCQNGEEHDVPSQARRTLKQDQISQQLATTQRHQNRASFSDGLTYGLYGRQANPPWDAFGAGRGHGDWDFLDLEDTHLDEPGLGRQQIPDLFPVRANRFSGAWSPDGFWPRALTAEQVHSVACPRWEAHLEEAGRIAFYWKNRRLQKFISFSTTAFPTLFDRCRQCCRRFYAPLLRIRFAAGSR